MLVLSRKAEETIEIDGGRIKVTLLSVRGDKVRLGVDAPRTIDVHRGEVANRIRAAEV